MGRTSTEYRGGMHFVGLPKSGYEVHMDSAADDGERAAGATPVETLLCSLCGCTGMDVVAILRKMKTEPTAFRVIAEDERAAEYPKVITRLHLIYEVAGDVPESNLKKAIELSLAKYCPIANTLAGVAKIDYEYSIRDG